MTPVKLSWDSSVRACISASPGEPVQVLDAGGRHVATVLTPDAAAGLVVASVKSGAVLLAEKVSRLVDATRVMRRNQREYFASRSRESLEASKKAEREVDRLLAELDAPPPAQGRMF